ncbi:MAG: DUF4430 domain-containing protein [Candidatus Bathyarchaeia archaeon]
MRSRWALLSMLFACWALIASFFAAYYWLQYTDILNRIGGVPIYVNVGVDYGNQTRTWYNDTKTLSGMTLFKVTKDVAVVNASSLAGFGAYITSINGVASNATHGWVWWKWDTFMMNWTRVDISADAYAVADGEVFLWYYESGWPPPTPP